MFGTLADMTWVNIAIQNGLATVCIVALLVGIRAVWTTVKPHITDMLKARLKRYETTTKLTEGLEQTLQGLASQQAQIVELMKDTKDDIRRQRKWTQEMAKLMADHRCMYGVDVGRRVFDSDSDEFDKALDEDSSK